MSAPVSKEPRDLSRIQLDLTTPDPARMVDFWLGGSHHFEVDRQMARSIERMTPAAPVWVRAQRRFQGFATTYLFREQGLANFIVAGAGLPTCGSVHELAPSANVLYTDLNPVTVAYGRNLLGTNPNARYLQHDARSLPELDAHDLETFFGPQAKVAIIYVGLAYFMPDTTLRETLQKLFDWSSSGSYLAITAMSQDSTRFAAPSLEAYARMGHPIFTRTREQTLEDIYPWTVTEHGVRSASQWGIFEATEPCSPIFLHACVAYKP